MVVWVAWYESFDYQSTVTDLIPRSASFHYQSTVAVFIAQSAFWFFSWVLYESLRKQEASANSLLKSISLNHFLEKMWTHFSYFIVANSQYFEITAKSMLRANCTVSKVSIPVYTCAVKLYLAIFWRIRSILNHNYSFYSRYAFCS
jgi:hypothetical protein